MRITNSAKWTANLLVVCFIVGLFYFGWQIARTALYDSDTCWLLAMGRWIFEHQNFPLVDPFSPGVTDYARAINLPLLQYQWLAELLFYVIYRASGLMGLVFFDSILACLTFVCLPYLSLAKVNCPRVLRLVILLAVLTLASFSLYIRPQMFSFLFLSLFIFLFIPTKNLVKQISWRQSLLVLLIMLCWVNTHIIFPLGIVFVALLLIVRYLEIRFVDGDDNGNLLANFNSIAWPALIALACLATFINPWGADIWRSVWQVLDNTSTNWTTEMMPINLFDWQAPITWSFLFLIAVYVFLCVFYRAFTFKKLGLISPLLAACAIFASLERCKLAPISGLLILAACFELISRQSDSQIKNDALSTVGAKNIEVYWAFLLLNRLSVLVMMLVVVLLGTTVGMMCQPITLPQASSSFNPPFEAINFLKEHRLAGKIYNDPNFGSMMCWYLPEANVFFDTRFSQYESQRMEDTLHIKNCDPGWEQLWAKYNCDWAFIRTASPLVKSLQRMGWRAVYSDSKASILVKPN